MGQKGVALNYDPKVIDARGHSGHKSRRPLYVLRYGDTQGIANQLPGMIDEAKASAGDEYSQDQKNIDAE